MCLVNFATWAMRHHNRRVARRWARQRSRSAAAALRRLLGPIQPSLAFRPTDAFRRGAGTARPDVVVIPTAERFRGDDVHHDRGHHPIDRSEPWFPVRLDEGPAQTAPTSTCRLLAQGQSDRLPTMRFVERCSPRCEPCLRKASWPRLAPFVLAERHKSVGRSST